MKNTFIFDEIFFVLDAEKYFFVSGWFIEGNEDVLGKIEFLGFGDSVKLIDFNSFDRPDVVEHLLDQGISLKRKPVGFLARYDLSNETEVYQSVSDIISNGFIETRVKNETKTISVSEFSLDNPEDGRVSFFINACKGIFDETEFEYSVLGALAEQFNAPSAAAHLESSLSVGDGNLFVAGWLGDAATKEIYFVNKKTGRYAKLDFFSSKRGDVSEHLRNSGVPIKTDSHGFLGKVTSLDSIKQLDQFVLVSKESDNSISYLGVNADLPASNHLSHQFITRVAAQEPNSLPALLESLSADPAGLSSILETTLERTNAFVFSEPQQTPSVSIVVPYHSEAFFVDDLILMLRNSPLNLEWILVCDDPDLVDFLRRRLSQHKASFQVSLKFLVTPGNSGFATASNVGAAHASSDKVMFMNSDVLIKDFQHIQRAMEYLDENPQDIAGFTLLFEDETIQHAGIFFKQSDAFGDLILAEHTNKGMPAEIALPKEDGPVTAVTGALLMIKKRPGEFVEYFSSAFINGDFEDVDLCLDVAAKGGKNILFTGRGMYHLERQSIGHSSAEKRFVFTLRNSATFTKKWFEYLDSIGEVH